MKHAAPCAFRLLHNRFALLRVERSDRHAIEHALRQRHADGGPLVPEQAGEFGAHLNRRTRFRLLRRAAICIAEFADRRVAAGAGADAATASSVCITSNLSSLPSLSQSTSRSRGVRVCGDTPSGSTKYSSLLASPRRRRAGPIHGLQLGLAQAGPQLVHTERGASACAIIGPGVAIA